MLQCIDESASFDMITLVSGLLEKTLKNPYIKYISADNIILTGYVKKNHRVKNNTTEGELKFQREDVPQ